MVENDPIYQCSYRHNYSRQKLDILLQILHWGPRALDDSSESSDAPCEAALTEFFLTAMLPFKSSALFEDSPTSVMLCST